MGVEAVIATQVIDTTTVGRSLMTAADAAAARTALSLGTLATQNGTISDYLTVGTAASTYQVVLVSGSNLKTINSTSLLGSGDITVSASPGGSSGQVQYNNAGVFGGMTAVVYAGSGTLLTVTSQSASDVPFCIKGAASQSGNLSEWRNSSNTILTRVDSAGTIRTPAISSTEVLVTGGGVYIYGGFMSSPLISLNGWWVLTQGSTGGVGFGAGNKIVWGSGSTNSGTTGDVGLIRNAAGVVEVNSGTTGTFRDLVVRNLRMSAPTLVPASASATGSEGQIAWDANYIYVCTATNTWKRVAIATW